MSETFALEFENVSKSFSPEKAVVNNCSFFVKKGEFFSILGPSGCGKTTCLRMISGLERPTRGSVKINGKIVNDLHPHKRNVHTVFQKYALFPHLNVFENVAFGLRMLKRPRDEIHQRVERMLQMVRLDSYGERSIQQLSGGEQQRVALVRALVTEPEILLLDEPLAALDLKLREQMQQELSMLQKKLGTTFIFVTHDQGEALTLSDRVAIMNRGRLEQVGAPIEVYEQPATAFVARFVGTTNVFSGVVIPGTNGNRAAATAGCISIKTPSPPQGTGFGTLHARIDGTRFIPDVGRSAGLVVRPEKIRVRVTAPAATPSPAAPGAPSGSGPSSGIANVLRGTLVERIYFGPTTQIKLQINEALPPIIALVANQTATKMPQLKLGERYYAVWDAADAVIVPETDLEASAKPQ